MQRAYSLIELSLVISIIGLLIAISIGGYQLIESAKVQKLMTEITKTENDVAIFRFAYQALPGDYDKAISNISELTIDGDGNQIVGSEFSEQGQRGENVHFWEQLYLSGIIAEKYMNNNTACCNDGFYNITDNNTRKIDVFQELYLAIWNSNNNSKNALELRLAQVVANGANGCESDEGKPERAALYPRVAKKIDQKLDDGKPMSGNFTASSGCDAGICLSGTEYTDLIDDEFGCRVNIVIYDNL